DVRGSDDRVGGIDRRLGVRIRRGRGPARWRRDGRRRRRGGRGRRRGGGRGKGLVVALVELLVQRLRLGDAGLQLRALLPDRGERRLLLLEGLGGLLPGPRGLLSGVRGLRREVGVGLGDAAHELQPVGELGERMRAEEQRELGADALVGAYRAGVQIGGGLVGDGLGGRGGGSGVGQALLDLLELDELLVVFLVEERQALVQGRQLGLGRLDVVL